VVIGVEELEELIVELEVIEDEELEVGGGGVGVVVPPVALNEPTYAL
jgi:hypothetical protein